MSRWESTRASLSSAHGTVPLRTGKVKTPTFRCIPPRPRRLTTPTPGKKSPEPGRCCLSRSPSKPRCRSSHYFPSRCCWHGKAVSPAVRAVPPTCCRHDRAQHQQRRRNRDAYAGLPESVDTTPSRSDALQRSPHPLAPVRRSGIASDRPPVHRHGHRAAAAVLSRDISDTSFSDHGTTSFIRSLQVLL